MGRVIRHPVNRHEMRSDRQAPDVRTIAPIRAAIQDSKKLSGPSRCFAFAYPRLRHTGKMIA